MGEPTSKKDVREMIQSEREALEMALSGLSEEQMLQPGMESHWSVKDILAHIVAWERRMVQWIEESLRGEVPVRPAPGMTWDDLDRLNEQIYADNRDKTLDEVLTDFHRSYQDALNAVEALTEEDLLDPQRFEWREGDPMWHLVAANTWWHYKEHRETIDGWMKRGGSVQ